MAKKLTSYRMDEGDLLLIEALVIKLSKEHFTNYKAPAILQMAIRKLAASHFSEDEITKILNGK